MILIQLVKKRKEITCHHECNTCSDDHIESLMDVWIDQKMQAGEGEERETCLNGECEAFGEKWLSLDAFDSEPQLSQMKIFNLASLPTPQGPW